jgi:hypothetical protein
MKIEKVSYQKLFPIGNFLNERIGFEASVDEGDDIFETLGKLKRMADQFHAENNAANIVPDSENSSHKENSEDREIGLKPEAIMSCKELRVLETYRFVIKGKPALEAAYNQRKFELENLQKA